MSAPNEGDMQPPPPLPDVWSETANVQVHYVVRHPWQWVMENTANGHMTEVDTPSQLPSYLEAAKQLVEADSSEMAQTPSTPATRRRRQKRSKHLFPATLKLEISDPNTGNVDYAVHGTSSALDGLEDKDELLRTMQRCRCDHLMLSPPSVLINWDVSHEECANVVGKDLPKLDENTDSEIYAVLKEPMGSQGKGIYFVKTIDEIHEIINDHRKRAKAEPDFLDNLIAVKGRIPSWVLQAEVVPSLLIRDRRKFHIRTYLVVLEKLHHPDLLEMFLFNRHEVRIAGVPVPEGNVGRDRLAHITNGALSNTTERVLLSNVPELVSRGLEDKVETFVAESFFKHLLPDIARRISVTANEEGYANIRKFAVAGLDLMVTEDNRIYLLEVNANPAAPPESMVDATFKEHLEGFLHDMVDLVVGTPSPNFLNAQDVLARKGLLE